MIRLYDSTGRIVLLNPASIESIRSAGPNSANIKAYIRTITGDEISCNEYIDTIENMIAMDKHQGKKNADT